MRPAIVPHAQFVPDLSRAAPLSSPLSRPAPRVPLSLKHASEVLRDGSTFGLGVKHDEPPNEIVGRFLQRMRQLDQDRTVYLEHKAELVRLEAQLNCSPRHCVMTQNGDSSFLSSRIEWLKLRCLKYETLIQSKAYRAELREIRSMVSRVGIDPNDPPGF